MTSLRSFTVLAYGLTWVLLGPWFYVFNVSYHQKPPSWVWWLAPLAFIGGWGPSVAAILVSARTLGRSEVRRLLTTLVAWRVPARWYLLLIVLPPCATVVAMMFVDGGREALRRFHLGQALANLPVAYAIALPFGPLGEELGWRGFVLPRLLGRFGPWTASLILGVLWTFWHGPMMLWMPGAATPSFMELSAWSLIIYLIQLTSETAVITLVYTRTNGSVLLAVLAHLTFNTAESVVLGGLPNLSVDQIRDVYLVKVVLLAIIGFMSLLWLTRGPSRRDFNGNPNHRM